LGLFVDSMAGYSQSLAQAHVFRSASAPELQLPAEGISNTTGGATAEQQEQSADQLRMRAEPHFG